MSYQQDAAERGLRLFREYEAISPDGPATPSENLDFILSDLMMMCESGGLVSFEKALINAKAIVQLNKPWEDESCVNPQ